MENKSGTQDGDKLIHQPYCFDEIDYETISNMIDENFPDIDRDTQVQILDFIDAHFYWNK